MQPADSTPIRNEPPGCTTIIFDLAEVLIKGLYGVEDRLAERLNLPPADIFAAFTGQTLEDLFCGRISEDIYLSGVLTRQQWEVGAAEIKSMIRENFQPRIPGMGTILEQLKGKFELVLLSDHTLEWIEYIHTIHPFLSVFDHQFFSFQLGSTKSSPATFLSVLERIQREAQQCVFIDDTAVNVSSARSVGLRGIQFISAAKLVDELWMMGIRLHL